LFNCGTGIARTWKDLATAVFTAMGRKPNIKMIEMPPHLQGKYQYYTRAEMTKLRAAGYTRPFLTLEEGVTDYVQNYLSKPVV
jgi:ADP-L-glycero-D-manno-heptose 6-epimerase